LVPLQHAVPVQGRQYTRLELPGKSCGLGAVVDPRWESRRHLPPITKLGEHYLAALHGERARAIAVIAAAGSFSCERITDILCDHRCLLADSCHGFGIGRVGAIPESPDVLVTHVTQHGGVDRHPTVPVSQLTVADKVRRALRGADMNHVERLLDHFTAPILKCASEPCLSLLPVDS